MVNGRPGGAVGPVHLIQLGNAALVHSRAVGQHRAHHIVLGELIVLCQLDAAEYVGNAGNAQPAELLNERILQAQLIFQVGVAFGGVEQAQQPLAVLVVDGDEVKHAPAKRSPGRLMASYRSARAQPVTL